MTVITMSHNELGRLQTLIALADRRISVSDAATLMGLGRRQVYRVLTSFQSHGPDALVSKRRGKPSNRAHGAVFRKTILSIVQERYGDFGPTLAAEKLAELHGLPIGVETLRQWMIDDKIWIRRRDRAKRIHQPRHRRDCIGELIQIDGCEHWWFEDRGPQCTLLVFVDDATSRLMQLWFVPSESAFAYFQAAKLYLTTHGKPIAFYSDKHSVFRVNYKDAANGGDMTQFGRALHELNIDILCANTPQAKGRVERAHKTLQDRLVKELRLAGINDIEAANALLPAFTQTYNARFAKPPRSDKNLHRPLGRHDNLDSSFAWREERTVTHALTVQYDRVMFILEPNEVTRALPRKKVEIYDFPDGRIEVRYKGQVLPYRTYDRVTRVDQGAIVENKRLSEALKLCQTLQEQMPLKQRSSSAPMRSAQTGHMFPPAENLPTSR
jgi:transposase